VRPRKRPDPIDIPLSFANFVEKYGGAVCDRGLQAGQPQSQVADYVFRENNIIAELKCLETDPFYSPAGASRLWSELKKAGMSEDEVIDWALGRRRLSEDATLQLATLFRRRIEKITRKAQKQVEATKQTYGMPSAQGLLLIANDNNYLFSYPQKFQLISDVFARHFEDSCIKGFVFFTPNVPMRVPNSLREWHPWTTSYSKKADDSFVAFVDDLGHHWSRFFFSGDSQRSPHLRISDREFARHWMVNAMNVDIRKK
jgi:hypothetical protein